MTGFWLFSIVTARAFNWDYGDAPGGNHLEWHMCGGQFTSAQEAEIEAAADAWLGSGTSNLRGVDWELERMADRAYTTCGRNNSHDEILDEPNSWFVARGVGEALAAATFGINDTDIVFNEMYSSSWSTSVPSEAPINTYSIGQVAVHEFGHMTGWDHEDDVIATMNSVYFNGGEIGLSVKYRIHEDDYVGMTAYHSGTSSGKNLMVSKFKADPLTPGESIEIWDQGAPLAAWVVCEGRVVAEVDGPQPIAAIIAGTSTQSPLIEWSLTTDASCITGPDYVIGSRTPTISSNVPYYVRPTNWDYGSVPPDDYFICVHIDADASISETSEIDNKVRSEGTLTVLPNTDPACP